jgi:hypothetical protein
MATFFENGKGVLMVEFMQQWTTMTSEVYCKTLKELHRAIQNITCRMLMSGAMLLHDNANPHASTAAHILALLQHFSWDLLTTLLISL